MSVTVDDFSALLSGSSLTGSPDIVEHPVFVTYSFDDGPADVFYSRESADLLGSFSAFTGRERDVATTALQEWDDACGVHFLQVAPGEGDIRFGNYDFSLDPSHAGSAGFAYYPETSISAEGSYDGQGGSDVFIDRSVADYSSSDMQHILIHEIGHALGLKHPFDGDVVLDPSMDDTDETVMSYNGYAPDLGPLDREAVAYLYGSGSSDGTQLSSASWDPDREILTQSGTRGVDVIRGVSTRDVIYGGPGNDILFGEYGNDVLVGGAGNDVLTGGDGADRFVFNMAPLPENVDTITDFQHGVDHILLSSAIFSGLGQGALPSQDFVVGAHAASATPTVFYTARTGGLWYDADGTGAAGPQQIATLKPGQTVTASDIRVY